MRHLLIAAIAALTIALTPVVASAAPAANSGSFTQDDGPSCSWNGYGSMADMSCSGYSRSSGGFVSYSCSYFFYSGSSYSYNCRSMSGTTWQGSR